MKVLFLILFIFSTNCFADRIEEIDAILELHRDKPYFHHSSAIKKLLDEREQLVGNDTQERLNEIERTLARHRGKPYYNFSQAIQDLLRQRAELKKRLLHHAVSSSDRVLSSPPDLEMETCPEDDIEIPSPNLSGSLGKKFCSISSSEKVPLEMGINLAAPQAESPEVSNAIPFANIFKSARPFQARSADLVKEQNGYPCFENLSQVAKTNVLESAEVGSVPRGLYPVHIKGDVKLNIKGADLVDCPVYKKLPAPYKRKCLLVNFHQKLSANGIQIEVQAERPGACLEDLKIILPEGTPNYEDELLKGKIVFNQDYLDYLKPFGVLRMMNLMYASPRLPDVCQAMMAQDIKDQPQKYDWNTFSPRAKACIASSPRDLSNRAKVDDATYGVSHRTDKRNWRGVPIEVAVELARQTGADPWINIPHNASPEYIREMASQFAELKQEHPNMKFHIEYSNEVWNGRFWGAKFIKAMQRDPYPNENIGDLQKQLSALSSEYQKRRAVLVAQGRLSELNQYQKTMNARMAPLRQKIQAKQQAETNFYVNKSLAAFEIFEAEIGADSLVRTLGTNQKDPNGTARMLNALKQQGKLDKVDAVATATYFHGCWGNSQNEGRACQEYLAKPNTIGLSKARNTNDIMRTLADPENPEGVHHVIRQVQAQKAVLDRPEFKAAGIELVSYEGGQHLSLTNLPGDLKSSLSRAEKKRIYELFIQANKDPQMEKLYRTLYDGWEQAGGKSHINFIMAQSPSQYGSFGISSNLNSTSAKLETAKDYAGKYCRAAGGTISAN